MNPVQTVNNIPFSLKTAEEIEILAEGGRILRRVLEEVADMVGPGVTGLLLDKKAEKKLLAAGASPSFKGYSPSGSVKDAFPATLCVSNNEAVVHGIPGSKPFEEGDLVSLDIGCRYKGLYTDTAITVPVGKISADNRKLMEAAKHALSAGIKIVKPGVTTGDIGAVIEKTATQEGYFVVKDLFGHGVGYEVHESPSIPNFGKPGEGVKLPEGTVIAIEPMLIEGSGRVKAAEDGWTVIADSGTNAAHEELTVAVVREGHRVLTKV